MPATTVKDSLTGVVVHALTGGAANHILPYYTARAASPDGRQVVCTGDAGGTVQAWLLDLPGGRGRKVSNVEEGVMLESVAFHPVKPWIFYASEKRVFWHDLENDRATLLWEAGPNFRVKSEISAGKDHLLFFSYEELDPGKGGDGKGPGGFHTLRNCRSYIFDVEFRTGKVSTVWGDTAPLVHPVLSPMDEDTVLFANQGPLERRQELFTIHRVERDNRAPVPLYPGYKDLPERPIYMGHSFFTYDGWVGCQLHDFGGRQPDGSFLDMVGYNAIVKADGTCQRRARCPGGNKPAHVHAAKADSWWVGDMLPSEGASDPDWICVMKNNWETGYAQAEPLCRHGGTHRRPWHVHPQLTPDEKWVLFNSDATGHCQVYAAEFEGFAAAWKDRVPFERRKWRFCRPPLKKRVVK